MDLIRGSLDNFIELIDYVYHSYNDLLTDDEILFYTRFCKLKSNAQKLYARMLTRKGSLFRASKLSHYHEIENSESAAKQLHDAELITLAPTISIREMLPLFNRREWLHVLQFNHIDTHGLSALCRYELNTKLQVLFDNDTPEIKDVIYSLNGEQTFRIFKLCFFGNLHQDLTEFVLRDLGVYRYPQVDIDASSRLFEDREQIEKHIRYYKVIESLDEVLDSSPDEIVDFHRLLPSASDNDQALWRRINRVNVQLGRHLERLNALDHAVEIYLKCECPEGRERLTRVYAKLGEIEKTMGMCQTILDAPLNEAEEVFAKNFGQRFAKKTR